MTIDKQIKQRKIDRILENIRYLNIVKERDPGEVAANYETRIAIRYAIHELVQVCTDLAFHICAINSLPAPESYRDAFKVLGENHLLEQELAQKMEKWAGMRNLIVHIYEEIDDNLLFQAILDDLGDFEEFLKAIEKLEPL
jgi:uncharacterized protein YutE (UPF0331/DUF86 family)